MKKNLFLLLICILHSCTILAQVESFAFKRSVTITEKSGVAQTDLQVKIVLNTKTLVDAGKMRPDLKDIRFLDPQNKPLLHMVQSGRNTANTVIWVKLPALGANATLEIQMYYGNKYAEDGEDLNTFSGPFYNLDAISAGSTTTNQPNHGRGWSAAVATEILIAGAGVRVPQISDRWVTIWDIATLTPMAQVFVEGAAGWHYAYFEDKFFLKEGVEIGMMEYGGTSPAEATYHFQAGSTESGPDMPYQMTLSCGSCTKDEFADLVLPAYHYGYVDVEYYKRNIPTIDPTVTVGNENQLLDILECSDDDATICPGDTVYFALKAVYEKYQFYINDSLVKDSEENSWWGTDFKSFDTVSCIGHKGSNMFKSTIVVLNVLTIPVSDFDAVVNDSEVEFTNNSTGSESFYWDFGDGSYSTDAKPSYAYATPGAYTVCLTATNICGADTFCKTVLVGDSSLLGMNDETSDQEMIYPNPVSDKLFIGNLPKDVTAIYIVNLNGLICVERKITNGLRQLEIPLQSFPESVYLLKIQRNKKFSLTRFIVSR